LAAPSSGRNGNMNGNRGGGVGVGILINIPSHLPALSVRMGMSPGGIYEYSYDGFWTGCWL